MYLAGGAPPKVGALFIQRELAVTLRKLVEVERAHHGRGRENAVSAVLDYIYRGPLADTIIDLGPGAGSRGGRAAEGRVCVSGGEAPMTETGKSHARSSAG